MPGCGKSTVGRQLALRLNRPFYDADAELVKALGCDIPTYFLRAGEAAFRDAETQILAALGKRSGCVIATGGGCVTREENRPLLRQNGVLVYLRRDLDRLPVAGRPVSRRDGTAALFAARDPLYRRFADEIADNNGTVEESVQAVMELWEAL